MEKMIDICASSLDRIGDVKEGYQWYGRAFVNQNGEILGVADDVHDNSHYFIFGKQEENKISIVRCIIDGNPNVAVVNEVEKVENTHSYKGHSTLRFSNSEHDLGACKFIIVPIEKTRETRIEEKYTLWDDILESQFKLSVYQSEVYENFIQTKKEKTTQGNLQKVYC